MAIFLLSLLAGLLLAAPGGAISSYPVSAQDAAGSSTGAAAVALGVPDYGFVNDVGVGFGGSNSDVFGPGESTVLAFPAALRNRAGQDDLHVSAFVGGLGETDSALVQVEVSGNGVDFTHVATFDTADGRTTYPFRHERDHATVKHFGVEFGSEDLVTHVRLTNLGGTAEGLRLDALEGAWPDVGSSRAFEIRFEKYRNDSVERFLVRLKNLATPGGVALRGFRIVKPSDVQTNLEETRRSLFAPTGEFLCVENCIADNGPDIPWSRHLWSLDGVAVAPEGSGLDPGDQASHTRAQNFDLDTIGRVYLTGFRFLLFFSDGSVHGFDYDGDVLGQGNLGALYQKYLYNDPTPSDAGPRPAEWYEFVAPPGSACGNGLDDDGDGRVDLADAGCSDASDPSERAPGRACDDGIDQDGDFAADYPEDPGCRDPGWGTESPQCDDGIDNDSDGAIDLDDAHCTAAWDLREAPRRGCGLGFELALLVPLLARRLPRPARRLPRLARRLSAS